MWIVNAIVCVKKCMEGGNENMYFYLHKKTLETQRTNKSGYFWGAEGRKALMGMRCESGFSMHGFDIVDTFRSLHHVNVLSI